LLKSVCEALGGVDGSDHLFSAASGLSEHCAAFVLWQDEFDGVPEALFARLLVLVGLGFW